MPPPSVRAPVEVDDGEDVSCWARVEMARVSPIKAAKRKFFILHLNGLGLIYCEKEARGY